MRRNSTSSIGALHPILFFMFIYGISLFMAIFVCRTVYNSVYDEPVSNNTDKNPQNNLAASAISATALK